MAWTGGDVGNIQLGLTRSWLTCVTVLVTDVGAYLMTTCEHCASRLPDERIPPLICTTCMTFSSPTTSIIRSPTSITNIVILTFYYCLFTYHYRLFSVSCFVIINMF